MDKMSSKFFKTGIIILIVGAFFGAVLYVLSLLFFTKPNYSQKVTNLRASSQFIGQLHENWTKGDFRRLMEKKKLSCPLFGELDQVSREFTRCNPEYIDCLLRSSEGSREALIFDGKVINPKKYKNNKYYRPVKKAKLSSRYLNAVYEINFSIGEEKFFVYLEDSCRDSYLPEDRYAIGQYQKEKEDWFWNNRGRLLFIDKTPIPLYKYKIWTQENPDLKKEDFSSLAENISPALQHKFCSLHSGKVLQSHILDAASFFPTHRDADVVNYFRPPYVWSKDTNLEIKEDDKCKYIYAKECPEKDFNASHVGRPSWIGLLNLHGGPIERIYNPFHIEKEYVPSSFYFDFSSSMHQVGQRFAEDEIKKVSENFRTTFRCMKEVAYENHQ